MQFIADGHKVRVQIDGPCDRVLLHIECPGDGCKAAFGCPDCEGTADADCELCGGTGTDPDHTGDCFLTATGGAKEYGYLEEFYEGTKATLTDGAEIEWYSAYDEWGWKLADPSERSIERSIEQSEEGPRPAKGMLDADPRVVVPEDGGGTESRSIAQDAAELANQEIG